MKDEEITVSRCGCERCRNVDEAINSIAKSYKRMIENLICVIDAETVQEKIHCINHVFQSVIGPDVENISSVVIDAGEANIELSAALVGQINVMPKPEKNEIN